MKEVQVFNYVCGRSQYTATLKQCQWTQNTNCSVHMETVQGQDIQIQDIIKQQIQDIIKQQIQDIIKQQIQDII